MFANRLGHRTVRIVGFAGTIALGYRDAAILKQWTVTHDDHVWSLRAVVERADRFQLRQTPLTFQAWRRSKPRGMWFFPVVPQSISIDPAGQWLTAKLGPPEG